MKFYLYLFKLRLKMIQKMVIKSQPKEEFKKGGIVIDPKKIYKGQMIVPKSFKDSNRNK